MGKRRRADGQVHCSFLVPRAPLKLLRGPFMMWLKKMCERNLRVGGQRNMEEDKGMEEDKRKKKRKTKEKRGKMQK